ncbi:MAG: LpxD N-terminal domain-containing protein, partial [Brevundimonas sp.]|uniref:LpxD N-terminal domain-containing protein n=1 Tax=Brevundimonas sp. TaxID=1871086 RepID=UPI00391AAE9D
MPDARFFTTADPLTVADLAALTGAEVVRGGEAALRTVAPLSQADRGAIAFLGDRRHLASLSGTRAGAVLVSAAMSDRAPDDAVVLTTRFPQAAWALVPARLHPPIEAGETPGVDP